jgi:hypothetical protein
VVECRKRLVPVEAPEAERARTVACLKRKCGLLLELLSERS